ncbi:tudor domain-containing protein 5-like [Glandiceps talaboti]
MSDLAKLREEVKKNVRALLISAPTGLTPNQLQNDYQGLLGHQLPYRDLGYNSSLDLLRALPDCVQFTYDRGHMILKGVADDTTKHIASLVARQRVSKRRGRGRGSGRSGRVSFVRRIPPPPPRGPAKPVIAQEPSVPAHVRNKIKELLTLYPNGLLGSSFNIAFARRFGHHIDFNAMGFKSLGPLLNSLTGLVRVEQLSSGGFKIFGKDIQACGETRPAVKQCKESKSLHRRDDEFRSDGYFREKTKKEEIRKKPVIQPLMQLKVEEPLDEEIPTEPTNYESENRTEETIDPEIKEEIRALLIKRPAGMWAARLPHEYKRSTDKDLPLKQLGFYSVIELVSLMPDVVSIERPTPKGDWLLYDAKTHHKKPPAEETNTIEVSPKLREKLTDESLLYNIWFTLSRHPNGVFLPNFQTLYLLLK